MKKSVLFISHDASRTGAPIVLLNFLKWFKENSDIPFQILLKNGGELEEEFRAIAPVTIFNERQKQQRFNFINNLYKKSSQILGLQHQYEQRETNRKVIRTKKKLENNLKRSKIGLIYSNTITNGQLIEDLNQILNCPVICHIHELEWTIQHFNTEFQKTKKYAQHYIACSEAVKQNLLKNHLIAENDISVVHEFVTISPSANKYAKREQVCKEINIPETSLLVGASGTTDWRKGSDLFIQLAKKTLQKNPQAQIHFIWIGGKTEGSYYQKLLHDIINTDTQKFVHFLGVKTNPLDYFTACDIFALMSREDPFPLVCLEAASVGKPILCFDNAGGAKELVESDCGFVVPYLDVETMAEKVLSLLNSSELRTHFGQRGQEKVKDRYTLDVTAPKVLNLIQRLLSSSSSLDNRKNNNIS